MFLGWSHLTRCKIFYLHPFALNINYMGHSAGTEKPQNLLSVSSECCHAMSWRCWGTSEHGWDRGTRGNSPSQNWSALQALLLLWLTLFTHENNDTMAHLFPKVWTFNRVKNANLIPSWVLKGTKHSTWNHCEFPKLCSNSMVCLAFCLNVNFLNLVEFFF